MSVAGVIQAGGESRRMGGVPKALIELGGRMIVERVVAALRPAVADVLVVTNTPERYAFLGLPMVADARPGLGALGGIYSGLRACRGRPALTVACDLPFLDTPTLAALARLADGADVVIPRVDGELQTLHAVYGPACLGPMERALEAGRLKVAGWFGEVRVRELGADDLPSPERIARIFLNVNTPEDLARARTLLGDGGEA